MISFSCEQNDIGNYSKDLYAKPLILRVTFISMKSVASLKRQYRHDQQGMESECWL